MLSLDRENAAATRRLLASQDRDDNSLTQVDLVHSANALRHVQHGWNVSTLALWIILALRGATGGNC